MSKIILTSGIVRLSLQNHLPCQTVGLRHLSKKLEFSVSKDELKQMSNKARVMTIRSQRNAKRNSGLLSKISEKKSGKETVPTYEISPAVSVRKLAKITGAPIDMLLEEVLSHVSHLDHFGDKWLKIRTFVPFAYSSPVAKSILKKIQSMTKTSCNR